MGEGVSLVHRSYAKIGVDWVNDYFMRADVPEIEGSITFYLYHNLDNFVEAYAKDRGLDEDRGREHLEFPFTSYGGFAATTGDYFSVNTSQAYFLEDRNVIETSAHELSHAVRRSLVKDAGKLQEFEPIWVNEGISDYHSDRALSDSGFHPFEERRALFIEAFGSYGSLRNMEDWDGYYSGDNSPIYSFLAAELMESLGGEGSLFEFYARLHPETTWQAEFKNTFGLSIGEFYDRFEQHEAAGFPKLEIPKFVER